MHSNRTLFISVIVAAVLMFGLAWWLRGDSSDTNTDETPTPTASVSASATPAPKAVLHTVRLTANGVEPKTLTIRAGDSVSFTNDGNTDFWPASDPHPSHTLCPGFDARRSLASGDMYTLAFTSARTCTYHNHLDPFNDAQKGTIIVQ